MVIPRLQDQVHGQVQVRGLPHQQGCPQHPPVHSPGQAATLDRHNQKLISPGQPHKLQDHRTVTHQFHLLVTLFPRDVNTSTSWDVIDPDCDEEVAGITNRRSQPQVNRPANTNTDSDPSNLDLGLEQVSDTTSNQNLGTLYNQDFFVADTTGRRLSQIPYKSNYPYPLPNGHSALQLRLPDLLIYLKTDTYLMDVNTGEHYAVYSDRIQKMLVTPKLYLAWGYRQLLHTIQGDALRFGVNSPQPSTSGVSQRAPTVSGQTQPSPVSHYTQPPDSQCRPTIVKYEPPAFSLEAPTQMLTRDE